MFQAFIDEKGILYVKYEGGNYHVWRHETGDWCVDDCNHTHTSWEEEANCTAALEVLLNAHNNGKS